MSLPKVPHRKKYYINCPAERNIMLTAQAISMGVPLDDIRDSLRKEGYTEYAVFLTYRAAEVFLLME